MATLLAALVLLFALVAPVSAQRFGGRSGSFGGSRSFGGGGGFGGSRSFGGGSGSFGGSRRSFGGSGGSFGGGTTRSSGSFGGGAPRASTGSSFGRTSSSSFGRTGSFGSSGRINSTSISNLPSGYRGLPYSSSHTTVFINGGYVPAYGYGGFWSGYSLGLVSSPWMHWMPFYPSFYVDPPYYDGGAYYAGGFSFTRFIFGILLIVLIVWIIGRIFRGLRGGGGVKYTVYR